jgi:hypothetical protein
VASDQQERESSPSETWQKLVIRGEKETWRPNPPAQPSTLHIVGESICLGNKIPKCTILMDGSSQHFVGFVLPSGWYSLLHLLKMYTEWCLQQRVWIMLTYICPLSFLFHTHKYVRCAKSLAGEVSGLRVTFFESFLYLSLRSSTAFALRELV